MSEEAVLTHIYLMVDSGITDIESERKTVICIGRIILLASCFKKTVASIFCRLLDPTAVIVFSYEKSCQGLKEKNKITV